MPTNHNMLALELHPLCTLFPRMSGAEFDALKADIVANGMREPIVVHAGLILDGGNRYRACIEAGVEPELKEFTGGNAVSFVLSANLHRRHLTPGQQAVIVASAQDWSRAHAAGGDRKSDQTATLPLDSVADRAAQSGASERTQRMADSVARQSPDLARQVAHGEISLPKALEQLAPKPSMATPPPAPATPSAAAAPQHDHDDAPDFGVAGAAMPEPAAADDTADGPEEEAPDPFELLREEQARAEQLQDQVDTLAARVKLLSQGDLAAQMIALEQDRDGIRNRAAMHYEDFSKANNKVIELKKLLDKLCKIAGVTKYGDLAGRINPVAKG